MRILIVYLTTKWHSKEANVGDIFVIHHLEWFADHEAVWKHKYVPVKGEVLPISVRLWKYDGRAKTRTQDLTDVNLKNRDRVRIVILLVLESFNN